MVFAHKALALWPGNRPKSSFRWLPFQSALSGSRVFDPPPLAEFMDGSLQITFSFRKASTCSREKPRIF